MTGRRRRLLPFLPLVALAAALIAGAIAFAVMFPGRADRLNRPIALRPATGPALRLHARLLERVEAGPLPPGAAEDFARYPYQGDPAGFPVPLELRTRLRTVGLGDRFEVPGAGAEAAAYEAREALWLPGGATAALRLDAPPGPGARLRFGLGRVARVGGDPRPPGALHAALRCGSEPPRRLGAWAVRGRGWVDLDVPLDACPAGSAAVELSAEGPATAHLLVAHPTVWRPVGPGDRRPPNVVVVNVDTLMPSALGLFGNARGASPRLDALAAEGASWDRTFANGNWSKSSHAAFFTAQHPSALGLKFWRNANDAPERANWRRLRHRTLAQALRDAGYATFAAVSNVFLSPVLPTGIDMGFERILDDPDHIDHPLHLLDRVEAFLAAEGDAPFFLFFNPETPHYKYRPPREYLAQVGLRGRLDLSLYLGEVAYADAYVGRLLDLLAAAGLAEDTLVLVTSDHGEQLDPGRAHALWTRAPTQPFGFYARETTRFRHGHTGFDEELWVPWIARFPGRLPPGTRIAAPVEVRDQAPTVLALLGLPAEPTFTGRVAWPPEALPPDRPLLLEGRNLDVVRTPGWKYVRRVPGADLIGPEGGRGPWIRAPEALYDLRADPEERHDLAARRPEALEHMRLAWRRLEPPPVDLWTLRLPAAPAGYRVEVRGPARRPGLRWAGGRVDPLPDGRPGFRAELPAPDVRELSFAAPPGADLELDVRLGDGRPLPRALLAGDLGLPLLPRLPARLGLPDARALLAVTDPVPADRVQLWRRPVNDGGPETSDVAALGKDLEDALRAWGYAQ